MSVQPSKRCRCSRAAAVTSGASRSSTADTFSNILGSYGGKPQRRVAALRVRRTEPDMQLSERGVLGDISVAISAATAAQHVEQLSTCRLPGSITSMVGVASVGALPAAPTSVRDGAPERIEHVLCPWITVAACARRKERSGVVAARRASTTDGRGRTDGRLIGFLLPTRAVDGQRRIS